VSERDGSGLLVFIPGFLDDAALWRGVIDRLALPGWESVPVPLRGTGRAEPSRRGATLEAYRDQVLGVLDRLDRKSAGPVVVVGHSMGAQVAELVAGCRPRSCVGLVLLTPVPLQGFPLSALEAAAFDTAACSTDPAVAAAAAKAQLVSDSPEVLDALVRSSLAAPPQTALEALHAWTSGHPLGSRSSLVAAPTLLIATDDTFVSRELVRDAVAPRFRHVETAYVPGAGHWPLVEQPAAVAAALTRFVGDIERSLKRRPAAVNVTHHNLRHRIRCRHTNSDT
jgi:pimeloyl-ACP methyl ester carboxylesterase